MIWTYLLIRSVNLIRKIQNIKNKIGQTAVKQGWWVWYPSLGLWEGPFRTVKRAKAKADEEITAEGHAKKLKRSGLQEKQPLFA